jgi:APA family basic amino acid/polyamine antiporter
MNTAFTFIELAGLAIIIFAGLWLGNPAAVNYYEVPPAAGAFPLATGVILSAAGLVFFAYFGFENLANISEETKNASKVIPKALIISIAITTGIYILVAVSAVALVGWERLSSSGAPLALAAEEAFGKPGVFALSTIALFATSNTVLMMLVSASRIMYGMSKGNSLPSYFSKIHQSTGTPWVSVLFTMAIAIAVITLSGGSISEVANIAVFAIFLVYAMINFVLIWLRYKQPERKRPFSSPLKVGRFPLLAGLGLATSLTMLTQFDAGTAALGLFAIVAGVAAYAGLRKYLLQKGSENAE